MIDDLIFERKDDTPKMHFSKENGIFEISGRSMPENVNLLFTPLLQWLNNYFKEPLNETNISINLEYFNSATSKKLVELLILLEEQSKKGHSITIRWFYKKNDFTLQKKGNELLASFAIPFELLPI